ncbi:MAG: competence protein ComFB [Candidatus Paceibacteria bacterium]|jgi:competence protein ComFB
MDDNIHNWYERLVMKQLSSNLTLNSEFSEESMSDIACLTLNKLPPKYVMHSVDMAYYTSPLELAEMDKRIRAALSAAIELVRQNPS